jgi:hypothetical protein
MFGLTFKRLVIIAFIVAVIFLARQYVPPYFSRFEFGDAVRQSVKYAAASRKSIEAIRRDIMEAAKDYDIPIDAKDIRITKSDVNFTVDIDYSWPIDLKIKKYDLQFHVSETGEAFGQ